MSWNVRCSYILCDKINTREDEISHKVRDGPVQYMIGELVKGLLQCVNCVSWMTLRQVAYKK